MCSFCGADKSTVRRLIAGPGVLVCEQCVAMAHDLLGVGGERVSERTRLVALDPADRKARCSFCGKKRQRVAGMVAAPDQPLPRQSGSAPGWSWADPLIPDDWSRATTRVKLPLL